MRVITVSYEELSELLDQKLDEKLIKLQASVNTGDELGQIGGFDMVEELTGMKKSTIKNLAKKRHTSEGIPCVIGRYNRLTFSSVAIKFWLMGKDCAELTAWLEEKLKIV